MSREKVPKIELLTVPSTTHFQLGNSEALAQEAKDAKVGCPCLKMISLWVFETKQNVMMNNDGWFVYFVLLGGGRSAEANNSERTFCSDWGNMTDLENSIRQWPCQGLHEGLHQTDVCSHDENSSDMIVHLDFGPGGYFEW